MEMAAFLNIRYEDLNFFIVGAALDSQRRYLEKLLKLKKDLRLKNLYIYGFSEDMRSVFRAADIYVCTSIAEASPLSVWEAMSMEKGIVSTNVGDVHRFLVDGENGFVVPIREAGILAEKVSILIDDPELRCDFGKKARLKAKKHLDIKVVVDKHIEAYNYLIESI